MKKEEFEQHKQLLKQWADEQAICEHRFYHFCKASGSMYNSVRCNITRCPNPSPRPDGQNMFLDGTFHM